MLLCKPNKQQVLGFCKNPLAPDCEEIGVGRPVKFKGGEKNIKQEKHHSQCGWEIKCHANTQHTDIHPWEQTNTHADIILHKTTLDWEFTLSMNAVQVSHEFKKFRSTNLNLLLFDLFNTLPFKSLCSQRQAFYHKYTKTLIFWNMKTIWKTFFVIFLMLWCIFLRLFWNNLNVFTVT